jgi:tetratricopeptide (TPR) repeat protein
VTEERSLPELLHIPWPYTLTGLGPAIFAVLVICVSVAAFQRNLIWTMPVVLWSDVVRKSPLEARPHNNLGRALLASGRYDEAIPSLHLAVRADPRYMEPHYNLALSYIKTGRLDEAVPELKEVLRINKVLKRGHFGEKYKPDYDLKAYGDLGNIYSVKGMFGDAIFHYREALKLYPNDTAIRFNLALTYRRLGMLKEAREEFEEILKIDPTDDGAMWNLKMLGGR